MSQEIVVDSKDEPVEINNKTFFEGNCSVSLRKDQSSDYFPILSTLFLNKYQYSILNDINADNIGCSILQNMVEKNILIITLKCIIMHKTNVFPSFGIMCSNCTFWKLQCSSHINFPSLCGQYLKYNKYKRVAEDLPRPAFQRNWFVEYFEIHKKLNIIPSKETSFIKRIEELNGKILENKLVAAVAFLVIIFIFGWIGFKIYKCIQCIFPCFIK